MSRQIIAYVWCGLVIAGAALGFGLHWRCRGKPVTVKEIIRKLRVWLILRVAGDWSIILNVDAVGAREGSAGLEAHSGGFMLVAGCFIDNRRVSICTNRGRPAELQRKFGLDADHVRLERGWK